MSEIYVKWNSLKKSSSHLLSYKKKLSQYNSSIQALKKSLSMSDNISAGIISSLNDEIRRLEELEADMGGYASTLEKISELYKTTEQNLL